MIGIGIGIGLYSNVCTAFVVYNVAWDCHYSLLAAFLMHFEHISWVFEIDLCVSMCACMFGKCKVCMFHVVCIHQLSVCVCMYLYAEKRSRCTVYLNTFKKPYVLVWYDLWLASMNRIWPEEKVTPFEWLIQWNAFLCKKKPTI